MILDDENTSGFWIFEDSIDYAEAGGHEALEDMDDEKFKKDVSDARTRAKKYKFYEVDGVDNRSVDYLISQAEKHRVEPNREAKHPEREL